MIKYITNQFASIGLNCDEKTATILWDIAKDFAAISGLSPKIVIYDFMKLIAMPPYLSFEKLKELMQRDNEI